jgi:acetyl esterase/lipase
MSLSDEKALRLARLVLNAKTKVRPNVRSGAQRVGRVPAVTYEPVVRPQSSGALLWIHGGGFVAGSAAADNALCSRIADEVGILVVSVDYRLAPEDPFPAGLNDCLDVLTWILMNAEQLRIDRSRVAVGGASAGGGLAAALAQRAHDDGLSLCMQLLLYPMLDDRTVLRTDHDGRDLLAWTGRSNRYAWTAYLNQPVGAAEPPPYAAPARREELTGLPPAWIGVGDRDLFLQEDCDYARRLTESGVECELEVVPGMPHVDVLGSDAPSMVALANKMMGSLRAHVA